MANLTPVYPVGAQEGAHRHADDMLDRSGLRRAAEIKEHRLEQRRLAGIEKLRRRDVAVIDCQHAGFGLGAQIGGELGDADGGAGLVKNLARFRACARR